MATTLTRREQHSRGQQIHTQTHDGDVLYHQAHAAGTKQRQHHSLPATALYSCCRVARFISCCLPSRAATHCVGTTCQLKIAFHSSPCQSVHPHHVLTAACALFSTHISPHSQPTSVVVDSDIAPLPHIAARTIPVLIRSRLTPLPADSSASTPTDRLTAQRSSLTSSSHSQLTTSQQQTTPVSS